MAKKNKEIQEENVQEETPAAASLHPAAKSMADPKALDASKVSMMKTMLHMVSGMGKEDMTHFFHQAMALLGHEADKVGNYSGSNQSSIDMTTGSGPKTKDAMPKIASITPGQSGGGEIAPLNVAGKAASAMPMPKINKAMKEDVADLFAGEDLSEEFKDKASVIFEAAVASQVLIAREELQEEFEKALAEQVERIEAETTENIDKYLDYVVEEWMKENEVAVESSLRSELTNDFIEGLKNLFAEHYIELPEEKVEVVEQMADKVAELEQKLDEMISENSELKNELTSLELSAVVEELASDLAMTQQDKFKSLAEEIEFDGEIENFKKKLEIVKETYFMGDKPTAASNIEEETFEGETESQPKAADPVINRYVQAITRANKK
jgi:hypothetical protein